MHEMILVGRGGQGLLLGSQMLAETFLRAGYFAQAFPEFKAERRGASIAAFTRWDTSPIIKRYKVQNCDVFVAFAASALTPETLTKVKPGGLVIVNCSNRLPYTGAFSIVRVAGSVIARGLNIISVEGRPMGNTAVLGACVRVLLPDGLWALEETITRRMGTGTAAAANIKAVQQGYATCIVQRKLASDRPIEQAQTQDISNYMQPRFSVTNRSSLENITGLWKEERPIFTGKCSACALCALFCPDGVIAKKNGVMFVDDLHCKGCGVCAAICPVAGAIHMEEVKS